MKCLLIFIYYFSWHKREEFNLSALLRGIYLLNVQRQREKRARHFCLSTGALMLCVVATVCCVVPGLISVCCVTVCGWGFLRWRVSHAHMYFHAQIMEWTDIMHSTNTENWFMDIRTPTDTHTHTHSIYRALPCFLCSCTTDSDSRFKPKVFQVILSRGSFVHNWFNI